MGEIISDRDLAAAQVGWDLAHEVMCRIGSGFCSAHQPIIAEAQRGRLVEGLLSDSDFMAVVERVNWRNATGRFIGGD